MSDSSPNDERQRAKISEELRPDARRLRALHNAWVALAPCCPKPLSQEISESESAARQEFKRLATMPEGPDPEAILRLGIEIDVVAHAVSRAAFATPTERLATVLPRGLAEHERGMLDLLDLLASEAFEAQDSLATKLPAVDYLITLLCTEGDFQRCISPKDPVTLTPSFQRLCQEAQARCENPLSELEAEFFTAANLAADVSDPEEMRALRARKAKLGQSYFVPGMLRAIVTYNMALLQSRQPWTCDATAEEPAPPAAPAPATSVFDSQTLQGLLVALKRRLVNGVVEPEPLHRIAWALDLEPLSKEELATLREGRLDPSDLHTCIILVGLLFRSLNVLAVELQAAGIEPDHVSGKWVDEVDQLIKLEVNNSIKNSDSAGAYAKARELSELRNRFLYVPGQRKVRTGASSAAAARGDHERRQVEREARTLANEAITGEVRADAQRDRAEAARRALPWTTIASAAAAGLCVLVLGLQLLGVIDLLQRDLDRWSDQELTSVSEHLVRGHRTGGGEGPAFVGTVGEGWLSLPPAERERIAQQLVSGLRSQGVVQVMIYDAEERLRIQALGDEIRTL